MKKFLIILTVLIVAFLAIWIIKIKQPAKKLQQQQSEATLAGTDPWWVTNPGEAPEPKEEYVLDPEIPSNYIPVINSNEIYMVINKDTGEIEKYRQRFKKVENGKEIWYWKDYNMDIPEDYIAVEGLDNVYKVTAADGTVSYKKYTRNDDDTFFFTDVDEHGLPLTSILPSDPNETPANYVRVNDDSNVFGVYDNNGVLNGYVERFENEENNGYRWEEVDYTPELTVPDLPDMIIETEPDTTGIIDYPDDPYNPDDPGNLDDPGTQDNPGSSQGGQVVVTGENGYTETETITNAVKGKDEKGNDCWLIYETRVIKKYDKSGELISTQTEGPTLINTLPYSETNQDILPGGGH